MPTGTKVDRLEPDRSRNRRKTLVDVVKLEGRTVGVFNFQPGWCVSDCKKPVAGYALSGCIKIRTRDGTETTVLPGSSYLLRPGYVAWVEGDEPFVDLEILPPVQPLDHPGKL